MPRRGIPALTRERDRDDLRLLRAAHRLQLPVSPVSVRNTTSVEQPSTVARLMGADTDALDEERQLRRRYEAVDAASLALTQALARVGPAELAEPVRSVIASARTITGADFAAFGAMAGASRRFSRWFCSADAGVESEPPPVTGLLAEVIATAQTIRLRDVWLERPLRPLPEPCAHLRSFIGVPLYYGDRLVGVLLIGNEREDVPFTAEDQVRLEMLGDRLAAAAEIARLSLRELREAKRLRALAEIGKSLTDTLDWDRLLDSVARLALPWFADFGMVYLVEDDVLVLGRVAHVDASRELELRRALAGTRTTRDSDDPLARIWRDASASRASHGAPVLLADESTVAVPLIARQKMIGILVCGYDHVADWYQPDELRYASDLAQQAAMALDNARLYGEAQRALHARDDLLAVVSHDLRTPLHTIVLATQTMDAQPQLEAVRRSIDLMDRLINDLLQAATIEAGAFAIETQPEPLVPLLEEAIDALRSSAQKRHVRLQLLMGPDLPDVRCDRVRVLQVLLNLMGNALKFSPEGGRVEVRATLQQDAVELCVIDEGAGIAPEDLPRLFDRYWKARSSGREGAGLGLYISKTIIEAHGGAIWAVSEPGRGGAFHFRLPHRGVSA